MATPEKPTLPSKNPEYRGSESHEDDFGKVSLRTLDGYKPEDRKFISEKLVALYGDRKKGDMPKRLKSDLRGGEKFFGDFARLQSTDKGGVGREVLIPESMYNKGLGAELKDFAEKDDFTLKDMLGKAIITPGDRAGMPAAERQKLTMNRLARVKAMGMRLVLEYFNAGQPDQGDKERNKADMVGLHLGQQMATMADTAGVQYKMDQGMDMPPDQLAYWEKQLGGYSKANLGYGPGVMGWIAGARDRVQDALRKKQNAGKGNATLAAKMARTVPTKPAASHRQAPTMSSAKPTPKPPAPPGQKPSVAGLPKPPAPPPPPGGKKAGPPKPPGRAAIATTAFGGPKPASKPSPKPAAAKPSSKPAVQKPTPAVPKPASVIAAKPAPKVQPPKPPASKVAPKPKTPGVPAKPPSATPVATNPKPAAPTKPTPSPKPKSPGVRAVPPSQTIHIQPKPKSPAVVDLEPAEDDDVVEMEPADKKQPEKLTGRQERLLAQAEEDFIFDEKPRHEEMAFEMGQTQVMEELDMLWSGKGKEGVSGIATARMGEALRSNDLVGAAKEAAAGSQFGETVPSEVVDNPKINDEAQLIGDALMGDETPWKSVIDRVRDQAAQGNEETLIALQVVALRLMQVGRDMPTPVDKQVLLHGGYVLRAEAQRIAIAQKIAEGTMSRSAAKEMAERFERYSKDQAIPGGSGNKGSNIRGDYRNYAELLQKQADKLPKRAKKSKPRKK